MRGGGFILFWELNFLDAIQDVWRIITNALMAQIIDRDAKGAMTI